MNNDLKHNEFVYGLDNDNKYIDNSIGQDQYWLNSKNSIVKQQENVQNKNSLIPSNNSSVSKNDESLEKDMSTKRLLLNEMEALANQMRSYTQSLTEINNIELQKQQEQTNQINIQLQQELIDRSNQQEMENQKLNQHLLVIQKQLQDFEESSFESKNREERWKNRRRLLSVETASILSIVFVLILGVWVTLWQVSQFYDSLPNYLKNNISYFVYAFSGLSFVTLLIQFILTIFYKCINEDLLLFKTITLLLFVFPVVSSIFSYIYAARNK